MITSASGRAAITASAVCRIRRRMRGSSPQDRAKADDRQLVNVERARDPLLRHRAPAKPAEADAGGAVAQRAHERGAERVARLLARDEVDRDRPVFACHDGSSMP